MTNDLYDALMAPHADSDAVFLIADDGARTTYAAFVARTGQLAAALVGAGVRPGDRIVVTAPKSAETLALYVATLRAGAVYLPLNDAYTPVELSYFVTDAAPVLAVCAGPDEAMMTGLGAAAVLTLDADGTGSLLRAADAMSADFATVSRRPDDLAALLYTSGTTGRSKGAMLTHANLASNARALTDLWRITAQDTLIHALPVFHTHGLFVATNTILLAGARMRLMARFDTGAILDAMPDATLLMGVPTFYTRLLADRRLTREIASGMRLFVSGSAPLLADTHADFAARTGHAILERYGMTETNMIASNPCDGDRVPGTVGYPVGDAEVIVTDPATAAMLPHGEVGMIEVRGSNVFRGYWNQPDKTAQDLRADGFFVTGDLGVVDADGRLSVVGRLKDLIITGGLNVYPKEVEDVLNAAPGVAESAVFGIPHPDFGEAVCAAVVPVPGTAPDAAALDAHAAARLARFKRPVRIIVLVELPRNAMGKVQKTVLRSLATARAEGDGSALIDVPQG